MSDKPNARAYQDAGDSYEAYAADYESWAEARIEQLEAGRAADLKDKADLFNEACRIKAEHLEYKDEVNGLIKAVAHIGIDFGYGHYKLEQKHIDTARKLHDASVQGDS